MVQEGIKAEVECSFGFFVGNTLYEFGKFLGNFVLEKKLLFFQESLKLKSFGIFWNFLKKTPKKLAKSLEEKIDAYLVRMILFSQKREQNFEQFDGPAVYQCKQKFVDACNVLRIT